MKITALVENTSCKEGIGSEHGLSLFIEAAEKTILFDTGYSPSLPRMQRLSRLTSQRSTWLSYPMATMTIVAVSTRFSPRTAQLPST